MSLPCCFSQRFTRHFLSHLCPASKPIWCFSVHHWLVNTVQRSPFLKNAVLTTGDSNFAIWRESVLVTTLVSSTTTAPKLESSVEPNRPDVCVLNPLIFRKVPSSCRQTPSKCALQHAGPRPGRQFSTLGKKMAELRCGTCSKRPAKLRLSRNTSQTPRLLVSNPGLPSVSCCPPSTIISGSRLRSNFNLGWTEKKKTLLQNDKLYQVIYELAKPNMSTII